MHTSEGTFEPEWCLRMYGKRTIEVYHDWGVLGPHTLASQCVQISPNEIRLLAETGAGVTHMPLSNCEVGAGFSPVPEMLASRIIVGLGTDGYINDPFQVMRTAFLVPKARLLDANATSSQTVFGMATEDGARVLGLADVGRLEPGWAADLVVLRAELPTRAVAHNVFDQLILWRNPTDVSDVMVAGRWLKREGEVLGADREDLRARCQEAADRLWEKCDA
jgi:5-methylthioadenosine/S-adenosylhomocysteine deaminase